MHTGWPVPVRRFPELTVATPRLHVRPLATADAKPVAEIRLELKGDHMVAIRR